MRGVLIRLELDTDLLIGHVFTSLQVEAHIHRAVCAAKIYFCGAAPPPRPREADEPASVLRTGPRELPGDHDQQLPASSHAATTKVYTMFFFNARTFLLFTDFSQKEFWLYSQLSRARIFTRPRVCRFSFIAKKEGRFSAFYLMMSFSLFDEMRLLGSPVPAGRSEPEACTFFQRQCGALSRRHKPCATPARPEGAFRCEDTRRVSAANLKHERFVERSTVYSFRKISHA